MDLLTAIILGIIEGVTEFLPISSTGHMILASDLMGLEHTEFLKSFEIAIQVGAISSVVFLYWRLLLVDFEVIKRVVVAFLPTGVLGLTLYRVVKSYLLGSAAVVLWSLFLGGLFLIAFEYWHREKEDAAGEIAFDDVGDQAVGGPAQDELVLEAVHPEAGGEPQEQSLTPPEPSKWAQMAW